MGALFEILNDTEKLACNFYFSTVSPDNHNRPQSPPQRATEKFGGCFPDNQ